MQNHGKEVRNMKTVLIAGAIEATMQVPSCLKNKNKKEIRERYQGDISYTVTHLCTAQYFKASQHWAVQVEVHLHSDSLEHSAHCDGRVAAAA